MTRQGRVIAIREAALAWLASHGRWIEIKHRDGSSRHLASDLEEFSLLLRTPFSGMPKPMPRTFQEAVLLAAIPPQRYGLDIWYRGKKVMNLNWDDEGKPQRFTLRAGPWEAEFVRLAQIEARSN